MSTFVVTGETSSKIYICRSNFVKCATLIQSIHYTLAFYQLNCTSKLRSSMSHNLVFRTMANLRGEECYELFIVLLFVFVCMLFSC